MLFTDPAFLFLFLPLVAGLVWAARTDAARNVVLVVASLAFYATDGGQFTGPLVASMAVNYGLAIAIDRAHARSARTARWLLGATVAGNLAVLGYYKYAGFLVSSANAAASWLGEARWSVPAVALPIGISFYTFHAISYVVDVRRGHATAQKNPVHAALYLLLFPQLIAGPIIRYREIADQLAARAITWAGVAWGVRRLLVGLGKKLLVADTVALPADIIFALPPEQLSTPLAWIGVGCYTLQIYFDFSGYSDMAIGLAALFGFRFPENFDHPYIARSVQDFWRRWHLSLSRWFRDYLYVPLGGNRARPARVYLNLVIVFFLCGLWHGASWTFVAWGLFHGAFLVVERLGAQRWLAALPRGAGHLYTLLAVMVGWVLFRADSLPHAVAFLRAMAGVPAVAVASPYAAAHFLTAPVLLAFAAGVIGSGPWVATLGRSVLDWQPPSPLLRLVARAAVIAWFVLLAAAAAVFVAASSYSPFIYFRF